MTMKAALCTRLLPGAASCPALLLPAATFPTSHAPHIHLCQRLKRAARSDLSSAALRLLAPPPGPHLRTRPSLPRQTRCGGCRLSQQQLVPITKALTVRDGWQYHTHTHTQAGARTHGIPFTRRLKANGSQTLHKQSHAACLCMYVHA